jgi:hypothetical protein
LVHISQGLSRILHSPPSRTSSLYNLWSFSLCDFLQSLVTSSSLVQISPMPCSQKCNNRICRAVGWHKYQSTGFSVPKYSLHIEMKFQEVNVEPIWNSSSSRIRNQQNIWSK